MSYSPMLDTLKVGLPLTSKQHQKILLVAKDQDRWQWVQMNPLLGELRFVRSSGIVKADSHSHHRELRWDVDQTYSSECRLYLEFSIPKFWYGHNIHLLYKFAEALEVLKSLLDKLFRLRGTLKLPTPPQWLLYRVDLCYGWRFPTQMAAQQYLNSLKGFTYPRKTPVIYPTSIVFLGATYSFKFYLKLPEFRNHDFKELRKSKTSLEWINHLEALADGVLRCEATLRRQWLKKNGLQTVADLVRPARQLHWDESVSSAEGFLPEVAMVVCLQHWQMTHGVDLHQNLESNIETPLKDGMYFSAPAGDWVRGEWGYPHPGGGFTYREVNQAQALLQGFIDKFVGKETTMLEADQVQVKLMEVYKPVKAARLTSFWLYVRRFGEAQAKEFFGKNSFNYSRRELTKAGVSLGIETPLVTTLDAKFVREFHPTVPSPHVVNVVDDFRDKSNILNFVPKMANIG